jgi:hypothetical protein
MKHLSYPKRFLKVAYLFLILCLGVGQQVNAQAEVQNPMFPFWKVQGNSGTNSSTNFIGTTDNVSLRLRTNNLIRMSIDSNGRVGVNTTTPATYMDVNGSVAWREVSVALTSGIINDLPLLDGSFVRVTSTGNLSITGFAAGTNGRLLTIYNQSANTMTFLPENAGSVIGARLVTGGGSLVLADTGSATFQYSPNLLRWVLTGFSNGALTDAPGDQWRILGNSGTNPSINFIGTIDSQTIVFRTNNLERARIDAVNGNMAIGSVTTTSAKLLAEVPSSQTTASAIYSRMLGAGTGFTYGIINENSSSTYSTKTGIFNTVSSTGTGSHIGINSTTITNTESAAAGYGIQNNLSGNGTGNHYGISNVVSENDSGVPYGMLNTINMLNAQTWPAYGIYNDIDFSAGNRYANWNDMATTSAVTADSVVGAYTNFTGNGNDNQFGSYNSFNTTGATGVKTGVYNNFSRTPNSKYGVFNKFENSTGTRYGLYNDFDDSTSTKYGVFNTTGGSSFSTYYGYYNSNTNTSTSSKFGTYNNFSGSKGATYGTYTTFSLGNNFGSNAYGNFNNLMNGDSSTGNIYGYYSSIQTGTPSTGTAYGYYSNITSETNSSGTLYGVYSTLNDLGTGIKYAGFFNATGAANYGVHATNVTNLGWAGYFVGDLQATGVGRVCQMVSDYSENLVRFGTCSAISDYLNGSSVAGLTVDYVADFDNGGATSTAIGVGSIEFLLDGTAETHINNTFSPAANIIYDLGTTTYSWDDVYADDFVNVSDIRAKKNIKDMTYGLEEIKQMKTISYELIDDPFHEPKIGLIAQDVLKLVPEAVKTHNYQITDESKPTEFNKVEFERMRMSYISIVPVLVKGMQEQQEQIEELKKQNELLLQLLQKK